MAMQQKDAANIRGDLPRLERTGTYHRVLVLHTEDAEWSFVVPTGYGDHEHLTMEKEAAKREAATLFERAQQLTLRANAADLAAQLCATANI